MQLNFVRSQYLSALGITQWQRRDVVPEGEYVINDKTPASQTPDSTPVARTGPEGISETPAPGAQHDPWRRLESSVSHCIACELHETRTQVVFGVGNKQARWLIIGEAPGAEEDRQGEPFVGRAGKLLNNMLAALGLAREDVYIANILKCRPPNNRDPRPEEVQCCESFLLQQVKLIQPGIILAVGRIAAQNLLRSNETIGRLRGKRFTYGTTNIPLVVTYHPAYLLRSPREKRKAWQDLLLAKSVLNEQID